MVMAQRALEAELLSVVRTFVLPKIEKDAPIRAWIVDDTGIPLARMMTELCQGRWPFLRRHPEQG